MTFIYTLLVWNNIQFGSNEYECGHPCVAWLPLFLFVTEQQWKQQKRKTYLLQFFPAGSRGGDGGLAHHQWSLSYFRVQNCGNYPIKYSKLTKKAPKPVERKQCWYTQPASSWSSLQLLQASKVWASCVCVFLTWDLFSFKDHLGNLQHQFDLKSNQ